MSNIPPSAAIPSPVEESKLWEGHSSQWVHFWFYALSILVAIGIGALTLVLGPFALAALPIPLLAAAIRWWLTKTTRYELTSQRLRRTSGILTRTFEDLELFRVKDYSIEQPLMLRIINLGNIHLVTSDASTPVVSIKAVSNIMDLLEKVRSAVQRERDRKRVRELDVDAGGGLP